MMLKGLVKVMIIDENIEGVILDFKLFNNTLYCIVVDNSGKIRKVLYDNVKVTNFDEIINHSKYKINYTKDENK